MRIIDIYMYVIYVASLLHSRFTSLLTALSNQNIGGATIIEKCSLIKTIKVKRQSASKNDKSADKIHD